MVKSARPLLVVALLAVLAACSQSKTEPAVTPVAALPEAPPPMIAPPAEPYVAPSAPRHHHKVVKRTVKERKVVKKTHPKTVKVVTVHHHHHHHYNHAKTAHNGAHAKHAATRMASRGKPAPVSVPLDSPAPATRPAPMSAAPGPLSPGLH